MKKTRVLTITLVVLVGLLAFTQPANAQESEFGINLRRDFGYGAGSNVRGNFTISLAGEETGVASVAFLIDGEVMALVEEAPFSYQFHTDRYGFGEHRLSAQVTLQDGRVENTKPVRLNFVTPEEERSGMVMIFGGMGAILLLALLIYGLVQTLVIKRRLHRKGQPGETQRYGLLGAAICPKCGQPFSRHIWGVNLVVGKLDRCEHCGKWSMTTRATPEQLRFAEDAQIKAQPINTEKKPSQRSFTDTLDDTRYTDG